MLQLMKLNEDWDQVYRSATLGLQHRLETLDLENSAVKQLNSRLLLKVEHQQVNIQTHYIGVDPQMCVWILWILWEIVCGTERLWFTCVMVGV